MIWVVLGGVAVVLIALALGGFLVAGLLGLVERRRDRVERS
jgi:hypothetical protein